jgi:regulator of protease activity HflC (stomatin/prohibitin superfamily)
MKFKFAVVALLVAALSGCGVHTVETGHRGVKVSFGQVEGEPLTEGLYFVDPFTTTIEQMDIRTLKWDGKEGTHTKDVQSATVSFSLNYALRPETVGITYKTVGEDWSTTLVSPVVLQDLKDEIAKWDAVDLVANRQTASDHIQAAVTTDLAKRGVNVSGFFLTDVIFSQGFEQSIERKVIAAQDALAAQNKTEQVKQEQAQELLRAQTAAQSMKIRADALQQNPKLVEWEWVQKWDGHLSTYSMGGGMPLIQMPTK